MVQIFFFTKKKAQKVSTTAPAVASAPSQAAAPAGKKVKTKKPTKQDWLDRAKYENEIHAISDRLSHISQSEELKRTESVALREALEKLRSDQDKIASFLKDRIREKEHDINMADERVAGLQDELAAKEVDHKNEMEAAESRFRVREDELLAEIGVVKEELNRLVAFRSVKDHLERDIAETKKRLEEERKMHREALGDVERKSLMDKEALKKERAKQLREISDRISKMTDDQLGVITKRAIMENDTMKTQLLYQSKKTEEVLAENEKLAKQVLEQKRELEDRETVKNKLAQKNAILVKLLETGKEKAEAMAAELQLLKATAAKEASAAAATAAAGSSSTAGPNLYAKFTPAELQRALTMREEEARSAHAAYLEAVKELDQVRGDYGALRAEFAALNDNKNEMAAFLLAAMEDIRGNQPQQQQSQQQPQGAEQAADEAVLMSKAMRFDELSAEDRERVLRMLLARLNAFQATASSRLGSAGFRAGGRGTSPGVRFPPILNDNSAAGQPQQQLVSGGSGGGQMRDGGFGGPMSAGAKRAQLFSAQRSQMSSQGSEFDYSSANVANYFNFFANPFPTTPKGHRGHGHGGAGGADTGGSVSRNTALTVSVGVQTESTGRVYLSDRLGGGGVASIPSPTGAMTDRPWGRRSRVLPLASNSPDTFLRRDPVKK